MNTSKSILTLLLLGALALSACQQQGAAATNTPGAPATSQPGGQQPSPTPEDQSQPESGEPVELSDVSQGLDALESYTASFKMSYDGKDQQGNPDQSSWSYVEEFSKQPPGKRVVFTGLGGSDTGGAFESIEVGGQSYVVSGGTCFSSQAGDAPTAGSFSPSDFIGSIRGAQFVGAETVNGIPARHFVDDSSAWLASGFTQAKAETWVADPGGFVVKHVFDAVGKGSALFGGRSDSEGSIHWEYEVLSVNQPLDIRPPDNCGGTPEDIPVMPDAAEQSSFGDTSTYTSASGFAEVVAFYKAEMPANGWSEEPGGFSGDNFATLTFKKDGRTASITITTDTSSNKTTVLISVTGE
jgi:hypothetical protein